MNLSVPDGLAVEKNLGRVFTRRKGVAALEVEFGHRDVPRRNGSFGLVHQVPPIRPAHAHRAGTGATGGHGQIYCVVRLERRRVTGNGVVGIQRSPKLNRGDAKARSAGNAAGEHQDYQELQLLVRHEERSLVRARVSGMRLYLVTSTSARPS